MFVLRIISKLIYHCVLFRPSFLGYRSINALSNTWAVPSAQK